ncbi:hypothetical protein SH1V18_10890 [Vallitalea longa]|uniref:SLH domain-containing protein n=1 Tax=Vallitalea longa TaxID=2936439 RepID=A0A9W6DFE1_9FIRM|nr:S-layer homology domain-containing protein [Vallitalea longa]GKX28609.1 hypothetical protein SH1V18_10890 [Vallitalea longa]
MKKLINLCMVFIFMVSVTSNVLASEIIEPSDWAKDIIKESIEEGLVPEHLQNNYQDDITREEFTELMVTAIIAKVNKYNDDYMDEYTRKAWKFQTLTVDNYFDYVTTDVQFTDTDNNYVKMANTLGIIQGVGDNKFAPDDLITREQAACMFFNYAQTKVSASRKPAEYDLSDIETCSDWARLGVKLAYSVSLFNGTKEPVRGEWGSVVTKGAFSPLENITREQAIVVTKRMADRDLLDKLRIQNYYDITMDELFYGIQIKDNSVSLLNGDYENDISPDLTVAFEYSWFRDIITDYPTGAFESIFSRPYGLVHPSWDWKNAEGILNGERQVYDFGVFTLIHNDTPDTLVTVYKNVNIGYTTRADIYFRYITEDDTYRIYLIEEE